MSSKRGLTWLHVSDLHFGHGDAHCRFDQASVTSALVHNAKAMACRLGPPDLILVTGDVAYSGKPDQYALAKEWINRLHASVGGTSRIFFVPGNHDVDRKLTEKHSSASLHERLRAKPRLLDELLADPTEMKTIWPKLAAFAEFVSGFGHPSLTAESPFYSQTIPCDFGGKVAVVGLNTALLCLDDKDGSANLCLGKGQLLKAIQDNDQDTLLLVLQHHPQEWLLDGNSLIAQLQKRPHIQFSGHVHQQQGILHTPLLGGSRFQFIAGAGHKDLNEEGAHSYAWGQLSDEGLAYYSWVWLAGSEGFVLTPMLDGIDFKREDHVFVERARLPKSLQNWLPGHRTLSVAGSLPSIESPSNETGHLPAPQSAAPAKAIYSPDNAEFCIPYPPKGGLLIGRENALGELFDKLHGPSKHPGRVALHGIGGLGKTQLAAEFCHKHRDCYVGGIYWLDAAQDLDGQLIILCDRSKWLNPNSKHAEKLAVAQQRLRGHSNALLVFDNVERLETIKAYCPDLSSNSHVLVVSRSELQGWQTVALKLLSVEESLRMLELESERTLTTMAEQDAARAIAKQLDGLPLALELVGAYLKRRRATTWGDCFTDLERRGVEASSFKWTSFEDESLTRHGADLHAALSLDEPWFNNSPLLRQVLDLLAWAGAAPMGEDLLRELLGKPEQGDLLDALDLSAQLRILSIHEEASGQRRFRMHRLVQQVRRQDVACPQGEQFQQQSQRLGDWFEAERVEFARLLEYEADLPHLLIYQEYARLAGDWPVVVRLRWLEAYPPYHRGQYPVAYSVVEEAFTLYVEHGVHNPTLLAHLQHDLGATKHALGHHREALKQQQQALASRREVSGEKHPETAMALLNLSLTNHDLGNPQEALRLGQQALAVRREVSGEKHPETARALNALGRTYHGLDQHQEALKLEQQALDIRREVSGEKHPETAMAMLSLASTYVSLKQPQEALHLEQQALAILREALGEQHPQTALALLDLGRTYQALNQHQEALLLENQAVAILRDVLGEKHPQTALALNNLGTTKHDLGQWEEALPLKQQALAIRQEVQGERHPETARIHRNLASTYVVLRDYPSSIRHLKAALAGLLETLGDRSQETIECRILLAHCWRGLKQINEALRTVREGLRTLPRGTPSFTSLKKLETELLGQPQKGFRQPPKISSKRRPR